MDAWPQIIYCHAVDEQREVWRADITYYPHRLIVCSAADVMKYGWPGGMEEEVVRCILKQSLEGLK